MDESSSNGGAVRLRRSHMALCAAFTLGAMSCTRAETLETTLENAPPPIATQVFGLESVERGLILVISGECTACLLDAERLGATMALAAEARMPTAVLAADTLPATRAILNRIGGGHRIVVDPEVTNRALAIAGGATPSMLVVADETVSVSAIGSDAIAVLVSESLQRK